MHRRELPLRWKAEPRIAVALESRDADGGEAGRESIAWIEIAWLDIADGIALNSTSRLQQGAAGISRGNERR